MIKISVIVPVYRVQVQYLRECIDSLLTQTCKEIEIILIDDGSKDDCENICDEYAVLDQRIQVVHQENQGVSVARNVGIRLAKGEWITFVDADDFAEPTMCEKILNFAEGCNADIAMFSNYVHQDNVIYEHSFFEGNIGHFSEVLREEFQLRTMILYYPDCSYQPRYMLIGHTFGKLIKREYLLKSKIMFEPELRLQQDGIFYLQLSENGGNMAYLNEPLYHYHVYDTSNCKKVRGDVEIIYSKVRNIFINFIEENQKSQIYYNAFYAKCISDLSQSIKNDFFSSRLKESVAHRIKRMKVFLQQEPFSTAIACVNKNYLTKLKRRNLFYYRHGLLWVLWLDWKMYGIISQKSKDK